MTIRGQLIQSVIVLLRTAIVLLALLAALTLAHTLSLYSLVMSIAIFTLCRVLWVLTDTFNGPGDSAKVRLAAAGTKVLRSLRAFMLLGSAGLLLLKVFSG